MPIQFKSPTDAVIHVASTSSQIARVGPKWRTLPDGLVGAAIAAGCISDNMTKAQQKAAAMKPAGKPEFDQDAIIRSAITSMVMESEAKPENFTQAGTPALRELSARCGFDVDREAMLKVWHAMEEEASAELEQAPAENT